MALSEAGLANRREKVSLCNYGAGNARASIFCGEKI